MRAPVLAASTALALLATDAMAQAAPRQPTGKWIVDFAENMCSLQREYGSASEKLTLALVPHPMTDRVAFYILDRPAAGIPAILPAKIGFGPGIPQVETKIESFNVRPKNYRYNATALARTEIERAAASELLTVEAGPRLNIALKVPGLASALKVVDECVVDLVEQWGFSREAQAAISRLAEPLKPLDRYVSAADYPSTAVKTDQSGVNSARYWIRRDGKVDDCTIVESSGSASLDRTVCRVVGRYRYKPALDKSGQPTDSMGYVRFSWRIYSPF